ncbi:hypothetical protein M231_05338 [Tremella mesenterica]|uniref:Uncharacterized protein n=1 Tax=Tremella mesenterica TaxID=5217 RepID=A0A4Q1BI82_TREME|nr:hypothetical protein M231_05338 [Tremella mesenterica]
MDAAIAYKLANPSESLRKVAGRFEVSHVTLHDRLNNKHAPPGTLIPRNLSIIQEEALIAKINEYAARGTLLTPKHVGVFAQALCDHQLGTRSGLEQLVAEKALHEKDEALRKASEQLDRAARGSKKRQRYPHGERFDQAYQESHAEELAERRETETAKREGRKRAAQSAKDTHTSKSGKECSAGPSRSV